MATGASWASRVYSRIMRRASSLVADPAHCFRLLHWASSKYDVQQTLQRSISLSCWSVRTYAVCRLVGLGAAALACCSPLVGA